MEKTKTVFTASWCSIVTGIIFLFPWARKREEWPQETLLVRVLAAPREGVKR